MIKNILTPGNHYCLIEHDEELQAITLTYKQQGTSEDFRQLYLTLLSIFEKTPKSRLLIDTTEMGIVAPDDQKWLAQYVIPLLAKNTLGGFLYIAVVVPDNVFTQLAVNTVERISTNTGTCHTQSFDSMASARLWLQAQNILLAQPQKPLI